MLHEIRVNGYVAEADGPLDLGTWGSYGTEQLHFAFDSAWDDLTKSVTFSTDGYTGEAVTLLLPESGLVEVPQQATAAHTVCGRITVLGTCAGVQRISADLPYQTRNHSAVPGQAPQSLPSAFEEISTAAELPSHSHTYTPRVDWSDNAGWGISSSFSNGNNLSVDKSITNRTAASGSGQAHNNMPPYYTAAAQIRARRDVLMLELLGSE